MAGTTIEIVANDKKVSELLLQIQKKLGDLTSANKIIGSTVRASVIRNFEKSGRPKKWKKHSALTKKLRGKGAKILMAQGLAGGLAASINYQADKDSARIGTNKVYAAVHQFGAKKGSFGTFVETIRAHVRKIKSRSLTRGKKRKRKIASGVAFVKQHDRKVKLPWGDIPARPFLMVQKQDWDEIREALGEYFLGIGRKKY